MEVKYIGKGKKRRAYRLNSGRFGLHKIWIESLKRKGVEPVVKVLISNLSDEQAIVSEIEMIAHYRSFCKLKNMTNGGDGISGHIHSSDTKKEQSISAYKRALRENAIGCFYDKRCPSNPWGARISIRRGYRKIIGYYSSQDLAKEAYMKELNRILLTTTTD
jgi:hypothetical protein